MNHHNDQVNDFLQIYYSLPVPPQYAVLIKGQWGAGKTWFVERSIKIFQETNHQALYVSLYGISSIDSIEREIFRLLHPVLGSRGMSIAGKALLGGILRGAVKFEDLTLSVSPSETKLPDFMVKLDDAVLVFDDLERCAVPIDELLGYINQFVEHGGHKVVLVANEEEMLKIDNSDEKSASYGRVKEKLIGKSFTIEADINGAINSFIGELNVSSVRDILEKHQALVVDLYEASEYRNLRHLRQAFFDFERLFEALPGKAKENDDLLCSLLGFYLVLSFETKSGSISHEEIRQIKRSYYMTAFSHADESRERTAYAKLSSKYMGFDFLNSPLTDDVWADIFESGLPNIDAVSNSIESSQYFATDNMPAWKKLWHAMDLSDEDLQEQLGLVETEWDSNVYDNAGVILHVTGILLWLEEIGVIKEKSRRTIVSEAKEQFLRIRMSVATDLGIEIHNLGESGWGGMGFLSTETEEFTDIKEFLIALIEKVKYEILPIQAANLLEILVNDPYSFCRRIMVTSHGESHYYNIPILAQIDPITFVDSFLNTAPSAQRTVCSAIRERYQYETHHEALLSEKTWLENVSKRFYEESIKHEGTVSSYRLKLAGNAFDEAFKALRSTENKK